MPRIPEGKEINFVESVKLNLNFRCEALFAKHCFSFLCAEEKKNIRNVSVAVAKIQYEQFGELSFGSQLKMCWNDDLLLLYHDFEFFDNFRVLFHLLPLLLCCVPQKCNFKPISKIEAHKPEKKSHF